MTIDIRPADQAADTAPAPATGAITKAHALSFFGPTLAETLAEAAAWLREHEDQIMVFLGSSVMYPDDDDGIIFSLVYQGCERGDCCGAANQNTAL